jgi:hypothetical protein
LKSLSDAEVAPADSARNLHDFRTCGVCCRPPEWKSHHLQESGRQTRYGAVYATKILHPKVLKNIMRDADLKIEDLD